MRCIKTSRRCSFVLHSSHTLTHTLALLPTGCAKPRPFNYTSYSLISDHVNHCSNHTNIQLTIHQHSLNHHGNFAATHFSSRSLALPTIVHVHGINKRPHHHHERVFCAKLAQENSCINKGWPLGNLVSNSLHPPGLLFAQQKASLLLYTTNANTIASSSSWVPTKSPPATKPAPSSSGPRVSPRTLTDLNTFFTSLALKETLKELDAINKSIIKLDEENGKPKTATWRALWNLLT